TVTPAQVVGTLRDDRGEALGNRALDVGVRYGLDGVQSSTEVTSDREGRFRSALAFPEGEEIRFVLISASFEGDSLYERVEVRRTVDLTRSDVELTVNLDEGTDLNLDRPTHTITVRAHSGLGGAGIEVTLHDELDRQLADGVTGEDERVVFEVASDALGPPGAGRLKFRSLEDLRRAASLTEVPIVRYRPTTLTLGLDRVRIEVEEPVHGRGQLASSGGPIEGRAVGIYEGEEHLGTVLTDQNGEYAVSFSIPGADRTAEVQARFVSDAPGRTDSRSEVVPVTIGAAPSAFWGWLLIPIALLTLILLWIAKRQPPTLRTTAPPTPKAGVQAGTRTRRRPEFKGLAGTVRDAGDGAPLEGAAVRLDGRPTHSVVTDAEGRFDLGDLPEGRYELRAVRRGYDPVTATVTIPHRGEWSNAEIRLMSLRDRVLAPFRNVVLPLLPSRDGWSVQTNREAARAAQGALPSDLSALEKRVEHLYYGPEPPEDLAIREVEAMSAEVAPPPKESS
ncbi:MAG: carboxypeptidase-like regulatory domain-containing protein, partial [Myxococcota bacterium]